jgi:hypothetical protein
MKYKLTPNILKSPTLSFEWDGHLEFGHSYHKNYLMEIFKDDNIIMDFLSKNDFFTVTF